MKTDRALIPGRDYTITVSGSALDAGGCALGKGVEYRFSVVSADHETPDPESWVLNTPQHGSTEPLRVELGSTHDHLSLAFRLRVVDGEGQLVRGRVDLGAGERSWNFTPAVPWRSVPYTLTIDDRLEDLAGNRPGKLFEHPVGAAPKDWLRRIVFTPR